MGQHIYTHHINEIQLTLTQLMSFHHLSRNITSQHYMSHTFSQHSRTQGSKHNITQPINIDQYANVMQQYTKTQSYMQCGIMSMKNLIGRLGIHDNTNHTLVSQVTLTR